MKGWSDRPVPGGGSPAAGASVASQRAKRVICGQYSSGQWILPEEETLVGALDLGGASTQISFVPRGPILDQSTQVTFRLYGANYSVYTHSYLCFGRDQILRRLLAKLAQVSCVQKGGEVGWRGVEWRSGPQLRVDALSSLCRAARGSGSDTHATTVATRPHCHWLPCMTHPVCTLQTP